MSATRPLAAFNGQPPPAPAWFRDAVAQQPERTTLTVQGAAIELLSWGPRGAPGVLLAHGARAHADWWSHIAPLLTGRRVTALSWSGMGGSDWRPSYGLDLYAEEAMAAAEHTGLFDSEAAPTFVGHSFGGYPLVQAASRWGERLGRIVLVDSGLASFHHEGDAPPARLYDTLADALARFRLEPDQDCPPFIADWLARHGLKSILDDEGRRRWTWRFDPALFVRLESVDVWVALKDVRCPAVFIRGDRSALVTAAVEARQKLQAPTGSRFMTLADAAHHVMADQPEALARLLDQIC